MVPGWAGDGFRALLFRIGRYHLAVPLVLLCSVLSAPDRLTRVPGRPAWHLGLARYRGRLVTVADLGLLLGLQASCNTPRYLLMIGIGDVAIACDGIEDAVPVDPASVRWPRPGAEKTWWAGLMTAQMCVLVDADPVNDEIRHG